VEAVRDPAVRARLARTLPGDDLLALQRAFLCLLDFLERDLPALAAGQVQLTDGQRLVGTCPEQTGGAQAELT
jgi:hypothetical protein